MVIEKIRVENVFGFRNEDILKSTEIEHSCWSSPDPSDNLISAVDMGEDSLWSLKEVWVVFEAIFCQNNHLVSLPVNKNKLLRTVTVWLYDGLVYTVSLYPDKNEIFSEQIERNGSVLVYRDSTNLVNTTNIKGIGPWSLNLLDRGAPICLGLWRDLLTSTYKEIPGSSGEIVADTYIFTEKETELVNKIMCTLFSDSVSEVLSNGNYKTTVSSDIVMDVECAGSGYRSVLYILRLLCVFKWKQTFFLGATVLYRLHPIIRKPFLEMLRKFQPGGEKISIFFCDPMEGVI